MSRRRHAIAALIVATGACLATCGAVTSSPASDLTEHVTPSATILLPAALEVTEHAPPGSELGVMFDDGTAQAGSVVAVGTDNGMTHDGTVESLRSAARSVAEGMTNFHGDEPQVTDADVPGAAQAVKAVVPHTDVDGSALTGWVVAAEHPDGRVVMAMALSTADFHQLDALMGAADSLRLHE